MSRVDVNVGVRINRFTADKLTEKDIKNMLLNAAHERLTDGIEFLVDDKLCEYDNQIIYKTTITLFSDSK